MLRQIIVGGEFESDYIVMADADTLVLGDISGSSQLAQGTEVFAA